MTGLERLRELADAVTGSVWANTSSIYCKKYGLSVDDTGGSFSDFLRQIADQIEAEQDERVTRRLEDREAAEWVREHGGLDTVKERWHDRVARAHVGHMAERQRERRERMQRHIEHIQRLCRERRERITELNKTIAEMRPRLMPEGMEWPKVDGKPVDFVTGYVPSLGVLEAVSIYSNGACEVMGHDGIIKSVKEIHVETPNVLDADGVEVEIGDDLYTVEGMLKFHVSAIDKKSGRIATEAMFALDKWADPKMYAHRAPVLAADGRPLREGETVYKVGGDGTAYVFDGMSDNVDRLAMLHHDGKSYIGTGLRVDQLTHERPDSWERLEDDATISPEAYCVKRGIDFSDVDGQHRVLDEVTELMARDLVRRARALAERGM